MAVWCNNVQQMCNPWVYSRLWECSWNLVCNFSFPLKKKEVNKLCLRYVDRKDRKSAQNSVQCELPFSERFINRGRKCSLSWATSPVPTIHTAKFAQTLPVLPTLKTSRQLPRKAVFREDELECFCSQDSDNCFTDLNVTI